MPNFIDRGLFGNAKIQGMATPKPDYHPPSQTNKIESKPCLCYYPCNNINCPKEKDSVCHPYRCEIVHEYSRLTYHKKYCSECGRKLKEYEL